MLDAYDALRAKLPAAPGTDTGTGMLAARTGAATLIVSHRFSTVAGADLILVMRDGELVECGSHEALVRRGGTYAELYQLTRDSYALR